MKESALWVYLNAVNYKKWRIKPRVLQSSHATWHTGAVGKYLLHKRSLISPNTMCCIRQTWEWPQQCLSTYIKLRSRVALLAWRPWHHSESIFFVCFVMSAWNWLSRQWWYLHPAELTLFMWRCDTPWLWWCLLSWSTMNKFFVSNPSQRPDHYFVLQKLCGRAKPDTAVSDAGK